MCASRPITACHLSREKWKHKQRLAFNPMIRYIILGVPMTLVGLNKPLTVNYIIDGSLGPFINFATNDCGHGVIVKVLVCNWVHPLFLKVSQQQVK